MTVSKPNAKAPFLSPDDKTNLRWLWRGYLRDKTPRLVLILFMVIAQGAVYQQFLALTDRSLRIIFENGALSDLIRVCLLVFGVFMFRGVIGFAVHRLSALVVNGAILRMRRDLTRVMMTLDLTFFETRTSGDFILRLVKQAQEMSLFLGQATIRAIRDVATIVIVSGYLIYKQPMLFAIAVAVIPFLIIAMQGVNRRVKVVQTDTEKATGDYIDTIEEVVSGIRTVQISNQGPLEAERLNTSATDLRRLTVRLETIKALVAPYVDFAAAFVYMLVIGGGGYVVLSPAYDVDGASVITFLLGLILVFDPGRRVASYMAQVQSTLVMLDSLHGLMCTKPAIADHAGSVDVFEATGDLKLQGVEFAYAADKPLFQDLSLTFAGGKTSAIVGTTGSGKTTVLSLLARLYDPTGGQISIGGTDVKDIKLQSLRGAFSVVAQDIVIFNASIRDNIKYVRPDASDADIMAAARAAEIADLMAVRGNTPVGARGAQLSGGQRQRIAIARAFLRAAPIVFLDEATSALDQQTEDKVTRALTRLCAGRTTIIVAHRLSTIVDADQIYVLENGQLTGQGSHADLMADQGLYRQLFETQQKNYQV